MIHPLFLTSALYSHCYTTSCPVSHGEYSVMSQGRQEGDSHSPRVSGNWKANDFLFHSCSMKRVPSDQYTCSSLFKKNRALCLWAHWDCCFFLGGKKTLGCRFIWGGSPRDYGNSQRSKEEETWRVRRERGSDCAASINYSFTLRQTCMAWLQLLTCTLSLSTSWPSVSCL